MYNLFSEYNISLTVSDRRFHQINCFFLIYKLIIFVYSTGRGLDWFGIERFYCDGMMKLNTTDFDYITVDEVENEHTLILKYLTCSEEYKNILYYLNHIMMVNAVKLHPGMYWKTIYRFIAQKHGNRQPVFSYILENYDRIKSQ